jgi:organic radical activating enzyme
VPQTCQQADLPPWAGWPVVASPWGAEKTDEPSVNSDATAKPLPYGLQPQADKPFGLQPHAGKLQEVFASVQGEGPYVGVRQAFVRLAHCHLHCAYCDTTMTTPTGGCYVQGNPTHATPPTWYEAPNPVTAETLMACLQAYYQVTPLHSVSLTGGEPLLQADWLATHVLPLLRATLPTVGVYLETSGTQPTLLAKVLPWLTVVSMDIKLASATGQPTPWRQHVAFANACLHAETPPHLILKAVVNETTLPDELAPLVTWGNTLTATQRQPITLLIQPETRLTPENHLPNLRGTPQQWLQHQATLLATFSDVRMIPQVHKWLSVS